MSFRVPEDEDVPLCPERLNKEELETDLNDVCRCHPPKTMTGSTKKIGIRGLLPVRKSRRMNG